MERTRGEKRKRLEALLLIAAIIALSFSTLAGLWIVTHPSSGTGGNSGLVYAQPNIKSETIKRCSAVTTCETASINLLPYSAGLVFVAANSTSAPSTVASVKSYTWTKERTAASTDTLSVEYLAANLSAGTLVVFVNYSSSTSYTVGVIDLGNSSTLAVDAVGAAQTVTSKTTAVSQTITLNTTNDIVFQGVSGSLNLTTITPGSGITELQSTTIGSTISGFQDYEAFAATGSETMSATITKAFYAGVTIAIAAAGTPKGPTALATTAVTKNVVTLSWTKAPGPVLNYTLYTATYSGGSCGTYSGTNVPTSNGTAFGKTGLTSGQSYCFKVVQWNTSGQGTASSVLSPITTAQVPAAPTGLTAAGHPGSTTAIDLRWTEASGGGLVNETVYQYSGSSCTGSVTVYSLTSVQGSYSVQSLTAGTTYAFTVQEWNATGGSAASSCVSTSTNSLAGSVTGLGATALKATQVTLTWTNPSSGGTVTNDTVWQGTPQSTPSPYCTTFTTYSLGTASTYTVTGLNPNTKYCFAVQAYSAGGGGTRTAFLNATTLQQNASAPTGLATSSPTLTSIVLTWSNPTTGGGTLLNNTVYQGTTCGTWTTFHSTGAAVTTYTVTGLSGSTTYCFAVSVWTSSGQSALSTSATGSTLNVVPGAPVLSLVGASRTTITVSWTITYSGKSYPIVNDTVYYHSGACGSTFTAISTGENTTSWQVGSLTAFTTYCLEVTTWTNGGQGTASNQLTQVTQSATPPAPLNVTETATGVTWISISWTNPVQYILYNSTVFANAGGNCPAHYGGWTQNNNLRAVAAAFNITGLTSGTTYCITVVVWDGPSNFSAPLLAATLNGSGPPVFPIPSPWGPPVPAGSPQLGIPSSPLTWLQDLGIVALVAGVCLLVIARRFVIGPTLIALGFVLTFLVVW